jgi:ecdysteroid kinase
VAADKHSPVRTRIPATPNGITPEYLTEVLRQFGTIGDNSVKSISIESVPAGTGFVGQVAHLTVAYEREDATAPKTIFAKLSSADAGIRSKLRDIGLYETEAGFYRDLSRGSKVRVPRAYACLYDPETAECLLLVENIRHLRFGDNLAGSTVAEARAAIVSLARMQAHHWNDEKLVQCAWLRSAENDRARISQTYRAMLPVWEQRWKDVVTPGLVRAAHGLAACAEAWVDSQLSGPWTLSHGDFRPDNIAFLESGELVLFDWQTARRSPGSRDLAYYLAFALPVEVRRAHEAELLELYHRTLVDSGVRSYSPEDVRINHRRSMGSPLSTIVIAGAMFDYSSERAQQLAREVSKRVGAAVEDHDFASWASTSSESH